MPRHYCASSLDTNLPYQTCQPVPPNCGTLGNKCCPPQSYGQGSGAGGSLADNPYCTGNNTICSAAMGSVNSSICMPFPVFPDECGGPGKPCCPNFYHQSADKQPPPICVDDAYCGEDPKNATASICIQVGYCITDGLWPTRARPLKDEGGY